MTKEREKEVKDYEEELIKLDRLSKLCVYNNLDNISKDEFNNLVLDTINLYNEFGINLQNEVFNNDIFPQIDNNNILVINDDVKNYMREIYRNNNPEINKDLISQVLSVFKDIYFKYKDMFNELFKDSNEILNKYGIQNVTINNISEIKKCLKKRIKVIYDEDKTKDIFLEKEMGTFNIIDDVCNKLTNGKYGEMNEIDKKKLYDDLPKILEIIAKYKLFDRLRNIFDDYNKDSNMKNIISSQEELNKLRGQYEEYLVKSKEIASKKTSVMYPTALKVSEMERVNDDIMNINNKILVLSGDIKIAKCDYVSGFYKKVDPLGNGLLHKLEDVLGMNILVDGDMLMGVFPIEMLPPRDDNINNMRIFKENSVVVPSVSSVDFIKLSNMCTKLLSSKEINNLKNTGKVRVLAKNEE